MALFLLRLLRLGIETVYYIHDVLVRQFAVFFFLLGGLRAGHHVGHREGRARLPTDALRHFLGQILEFSSFLVNVAAVLLLLWGSSLAALTLSRSRGLIGLVFSWRSSRISLTVG